MNPGPSLYFAGLCPFVPGAGLRSLYCYRREIFASQFPHGNGNPDYTAVVNDRHYARLVSYLDEASVPRGELSLYVKKS